MKKVNWLLVIGMIIGTLYYAIFKYDSDRIFAYLVLVPVIGGPLLLMGSKFKLEKLELCCYYVFVFMAYFLGCVVNLYNTTEWFDVIVHFGSGIFSFFVGVFILDRIDLAKDNLLFRIFFCSLVVMAVASLWELFEFGSDVLFGTNLQHGNNGVMDTMIDMLVAFIGGILFCVGYYIVWKRK